MDGLQLKIFELDEKGEFNQTYTFDVADFQFNTSLLTIPTLSCTLKRSVKIGDIENIEKAFITGNGSSEAVLVNSKVDFEITGKMGFESGKYATINRSSKYINMFNMSFIILGFEDTEATMFKLRLVEKNAYLLSKKHFLFTRSVPNKALDASSHAYLNDYIQEMTGGVVMCQKKGDVILDGDYRTSVVSADAEKHLVSVTGYHKPEHISSFMGAVLECRRYGYALAYLPEFGTYMMKDLLWEDGFDAFDYFLVNDLMRQPINATFKGFIESAASPFNISNASCFFRKQPTRYNDESIPDVAKFIRQSMEGKVNPDAPKPPQAGTFDSRYSQLPGMRYDVLEDSFDCAYPAAYRRLLADIQFACMANNTRIITLSIPSGGMKDALRSSMLSRSIGFIGQRSMCVAVGLQNYVDLEKVGSDLKGAAMEQEKKEEQAAKEPGAEPKGGNNNASPAESNSDNRKKAAIIRQKSAWAASAPLSVYKPSGLNVSLKPELFKVFSNYTYRSPYKKVSDILAGVEIKSANDNCQMTFTFAERVQFPDAPLTLTAYKGN